MFRLFLTGVILWPLLFSGTSVAQPVDKVVAAHYSPLMIENDEGHTGYAIEVLREAGKRSGREVDINFLPFERAMAELQSDQATMMPALFYGKKRNDSFNWIVEIESAKLRFATTSGLIDDLESARNLASIVVENGTTADVFLSGLGFENLTKVVSPDSSARMLSAGRVSAWFQDDKTITQAWRRLSLPSALEIGDVIHEIPIFMVGSLSLPEDVAQIYKQAVQSMRDDGTLETIRLRYYSP